MLIVEEGSVFTAKADRLRGYRRPQTVAGGIGDDWPEAVSCKVRGSVATKQFQRMPKLQSLGASSSQTVRHLVTICRTICHQRSQTGSTPATTDRAVLMPGGCLHPVRSCANQSRTPCFVRQRYWRDVYAFGSKLLPEETRIPAVYPFGSESLPEESASSTSRPVPAKPTASRVRPYSRPALAQVKF
jgi:hypothetical protein